MLGTCIFTETNASYDYKSILHYGDDIIQFYEHPKDRTMNEIRRDIYYQLDTESKTNKERIEHYTTHKQNVFLKEKNKKMHDYFYRATNKRWIDFIQDFHFFQWNKHPIIPNFLYKPIVNGRFVLYDGNEIRFVGDSIDSYILYRWSGS
jgi:hypothetical protein